MLSVPRKLTLLSLSLIALTLGSCGFNEELTSRGFIKSGDQICADTLVRTGLGFSSTTSQSDFLSALGNAYGDAAARFRRLDVRSDDDAMRDTIATRFAAFSRQLDAAATGGPTEARRIFAEGAAFEDRLRAYG